MSIEDKLKAHISKELIAERKTELEFDTDLVGLIDSTGVLELVVWVESTFGCSVELEDLTAENFGTIRRIAELIRKNSEEPVE